ncbi:slipin family protein [Flaviaesturariibacter aridisoli]|uniref:Slipin family protein n=1 Tax=Flaviaesturariibacter aridisoli TaxID=2545761 RepID=A0A4R4E2H8_9BACT|nr:slipin family protein [Flaviaesturariibacter aridisoli]TCZ73087.1 slipin family protein [Flaviaesturariibacter aridisoli]
MKKVRIAAVQAALVFRHGVYQRLLTEGVYWLWGADTAQVFDRGQPFVPGMELNLLLAHEDLARELEVVEVAGHEIVLQYSDGVLNTVLTPGRYAFWKGVLRYDFVRADLSKIAITEPIDRTTLGHRLVAPFVRSYTVEAFERAVLLVDGKYAGLLDSGTYQWWKNAITIQVAKVDTRLQQLELSGQEILTRDKAMLRINAFAQYGVTDVEKALLHNKEHERQLYVQVQLALREYIGGYSLDELLEKRADLVESVLRSVQTAAATLGVEVRHFGIRDIILPGDVKEILNSMLLAEKKAQANSIMRREETASTRSLLNTAKLMEENSMLFKLKELEYVEKIADRIGSLSVSGNSQLLEQLKALFVPK